MWNIFKSHEKCKTYFSLITISSHCLKIKLLKKQKAFIRNEGRKRLENNVYFLLTTTFFPLVWSILPTLPNIPSTRRSPHRVFATERAHSATTNILYKPAPPFWVFPEMYQIGRWKIKHAGTFLGHGPRSLEHWPLWLAGVRWPCPIPPSARHSSQCQQKTGALIRDARWWQFISSPHAWWNHCATRTGWEHTLQDGVNIDGERQTKMSFVLYCFSATYFSISCAAGDDFLILGCLYVQIGWWPFVCRWPDLRWRLILWQKKMCGHALWRSL